MFDRGLFEGEIPNFGGEKSSRNTIVSKELASELGLEVGGRLELLMADDDGSLRRDLYRIAAIYTAGGGAAEKGVVLTDIRNVQRLNGWGESQISGYEISLSNRDKSVEIADQINIEILYNENEELDQSAAYAIERLYPSIFDWLAALDMNGVVIISIMMVVAIFNIITALLILVLERVQMIGVLKALGMNNSSLRQVFLLRALSITFWGLIWGNGVGIALSLLQRHFEVVKLDETGYLLDTVPIELGVGWITLLNIGVIVAIIIVVSVPTRIVGSIEPHKAIKFQ
ncbi:MAG: FtsX-like permease family protein, partial [Rikenellaceae bacterium]